jgi:hypothetical protein
MNNCLTCAHCVLSELGQPALSFHGMIDNLSKILGMWAIRPEFWHVAPFCAHEVAPGG